MPRCLARTIVTDEPEEEEEESEKPYGDCQNMNNAYETRSAWQVCHQMEGGGLDERLNSSSTFSKLATMVDACPLVAMPVSFVLASRPKRRHNASKHCCCFRICYGIVMPRQCLLRGNFLSNRER